MQAQYNWIAEQIAQDKTVLAYDRRIAGGKVHRVKAVNGVVFVEGELWVHGNNARGWTFAVKPEGKK